MSHAHDIRRHLLAARLDIEAAQSVIDENDTPDLVRMDVAELLREISIVESLVATWAEE